MATRLFLRETTANVTGFARTEQSSALPVGTLDDSGGVARDLETTKGAAQTSQANTTRAQTADQDGYFGKFISDPLAVASISANTWTIGLAVQESNTNANAFLILSLYVLTAADTVRGFIYDSHTSLGVEWTTAEDGQVLTFAGSAVSGIVSTDRLCLEVWHHAAQGMAASYTVTIYFAGATDVTDTTTTNAASYIETPQDGLFVATTQISVAASLTLTPALVLKGLKTVGAELTLTPAVARASIFPRAAEVALTLTASVTRASIFPRAAAVALTLTASVTRAAIFAQAVAATLTLTPAVAKTIAKTVAVALSLGTSVGALIGKTVSVALSLPPAVAVTYTAVRAASVVMTLALAVTRALIYVSSGMSRMCRRLLLGS